MQIPTAHSLTPRPRPPPPAETHLDNSHARGDAVGCARVVQEGVFAEGDVRAKVRLKECVVQAACRRGQCMVEEAKAMM